MPSVSLTWFRHFVVQTLIHGRYFFFSVKETVFSVLWVKIVSEHLTIRYKWINTILCLLTMWRKLSRVNPLNPELNPICYLLALLGAHHFLHVSRIRVKLLTLRRLMSYIYGSPILDVSRSHTTTQHSR